MNVPSVPAEGPPGWLARRLGLRSDSVGASLRNYWSNRVMRRLYYPAANRKAVRGIPARYGDDGLRIYLKAGDRVISAAIAAHGGYASAEVEAVSSLLRPGDVAVDIGANIGCHTLAFAQRVGPTGRVLSFEPEPENLRLLRASLRLNGFENVTVHALALSDGPGRVALHRSGDNSGAHWVSPVGGPAQEGTVEVEAATLDSAIAASGVERVDLVKADVEGFEWRVLQGARETLRRHQPIVMTEYSPVLLAARGADPAAYLDAFVALGYSFSVLREDGKAQPRTPARILAETPPRWVNLLLLPGSRAAAAAPQAGAA